MKLYSALSSVGFLRRSYALKFLFVTFIGIHIPLIGLVFFVAFYEKAVSPLAVVVFTLFMTLAATALTLLVLKKLLRPISDAGRELAGYTRQRSLPRLPIGHTDEVGQLMRDIQSLVQRTESLYTQRRQLAEMLSRDIRALAPVEAAGRLKRENKDPMLDSYIAEIATSSQKILSFINDLADTAAHEEAISKKSLQAQTVDFAALVGEAERRLAGRIAEKGLSVRADFGSSATAVVKVDKALLEQVVFDLLEHAVLFSKDGGDVHFTLDRRSRSISFSVSGSGKAPEHPELLLRKVKPLSDPGGDPEASAGLYLSAQIVNKFEGNLTATGHGAGDGATFSVELRSYTRHRRRRNR
jgi:signal transduction histidine kinase